MSYAVRFRLVIGAGVAVIVAALLVLALGLGGGDDSSPAPTGPLLAAAFTDSVGVNVHLSYNDTAYGDGPRIRRSLQELGVRHVRDGLELGREDQWQRMRELASDGIRSTLILGAPGKPIPAFVDALRGPLRGAVAAVESPNEFDGTGGAGWAAALKAYDRELRSALEADPALARLPLIGPSLIRRESRDELGDVSGQLDLGNMHSYPGGRAPELNLDSELTLAAKNSGSKPVQVTETGYHNATAATEGQPAVSERTAADYLPRLFLASFAAGVRRTFSYELADVSPDPGLGSPDNHFGLLRADLTPKPAYAALRNLLALTAGPRPQEAPAPYPVAVTSGGTELEQLVLARADGHRIVALWRPVDASEEVAGRRVGVRLPDRARTVSVHRPSRAASPERVERDVEDLDVALGGDVVVLDIEP